MKTPSRLTLLLMAAAFSITPTFASLLIYEPFNYSPGSSIIGQTDIVTSATAIWNQAGSNGPIRHQVISGSLTGLPLSQGNSGDTKLVDNSEYARMNLGTTFDAGTTPNYTLFYSLLIDVPSTNGLTIAHSNVNANNDGIIAFNNTAGAQANRPSLWAGELVIRLGSDPSKFNLGVRGTTTAAGTTFFSGDLNTNQSYLVVVEYAAANAAGVAGTN